MIPAMKASPVDTFCRALVMGAIIGAVGWAAVRYTTLPQQALQKVIAWSKTATEQLNQNTVANNPNAPNSATVSRAGPPSPELLAKPQPRTTPVNTGRPPYAARQAVYQEPLQQATGTVVTSDPRKIVEQRLCELGAVYSLLEMWGDQNSRYRYHCRIAMAGNRQITRSFEANGTSPEDAMGQVLQAVEAFRTTTGFVGSQPR